MYQEMQTDQYNLNECSAELITCWLGVWGVGKLLLEDAIHLVESLFKYRLFV